MRELLSVLLTPPSTAPELLSARELLSTVEALESEDPRESLVPVLESVREELVSTLDESVAVPLLSLRLESVPLAFESLECTSPDELPSRRDDESVLGLESLECTSPDDELSG